MDDLDALLCDLQQTNEKLLVQNKPSSISTPSTIPKPVSSNNHGYQPKPAISSTTNQTSYSDSYQIGHKSSRVLYDDPYSGSDYNGSVQYKNQQTVPSGTRNSQPQIDPSHQRHGGLQANMQELNQMLAGLDDTDFMSNMQTKDSEYGVSNGRNGRPSRDSSGPQGKTVSVQNAAQDLDDLMNSLNQFKLRNQSTGSNHTSTSSVPPAPHSDLDQMLGSLTSDINRQGVDTTSKGLCSACNKPIVGKMITALGRCWHLEHFVCSECRESLGSQNFYERDNEPFCEGCYQSLFSPKCAYCEEPILDKCLTAMDLAWHPEHFFCTQCQRPFEEGVGFHEKNNRPYCPECFFDNYGPKCGGCSKPITDTYISALNTQWHNSCFVCYECRKGFGGGSFFELDGYPYCETHYHARRGSLCHACNYPVTGRCINALGRKYHPEHFVCSFCLKELNKGTFKEQSEKPYCHECFVKLFG